ncbi:MAG: hypothetical protein MPL62_10050 [Alphaproteobacteria bacterium]|nr:hypothetical protein [Alphaproteobacteria bacterium]
MATALSAKRAQERLQSMQRSNALARVRKKTEGLQHTLIGAAAAYAMGTLERTTSTPLPTILGLDHKLTWSGIFTLVAMSTSGNIGRACAAIADGLLISYGYAQGLGGKGATIRGEDEDLDI